MGFLGRKNYVCYRLSYELHIVLVCLFVVLNLFIVVVSSDMVKRLINKMDFEALEVKLKKCKVLCGGEYKQEREF